MFNWKQQKQGIQLRYASYNQTKEHFTIPFFGVSMNVCTQSFPKSVYKIFSNIFWVWLLILFLKRWIKTIINCYLLKFSCCRTKHGKRSLSSMASKIFNHLLLKTRKNFDKKNFMSLVKAHYAWFFTSLMLT